MAVFIAKYGKSPQTLENSGFLAPRYTGAKLINAVIFAPFLPFLPLFCPQNSTKKAAPPPVIETNNETAKKG